VEKNPIGHRLIVEWDKSSTSFPYLHKYGGIPSNGASLPICNGCKEPFHLLFQIDLADPDLAYLGLNWSDYMFFFTCLNCASHEKVMVHRFTNRGREIIILKQSPRKFIAAYPNSLIEKPVAYRLLQADEYPLTEEDEWRLLSREGKHQLGGIPVWVQDAEHITCIECGKEMEYIAMVDSELYIGKNGFRERGHMFDDEGILCYFVCRKCGLFSSISQCS
jgi:hypothetical protein